MEKTVQADINIGGKIEKVEIPESIAQLVLSLQQSKFITEKQGDFLCTVSNVSFLVGWHQCWNFVSDFMNKNNIKMDKI